LSYAEATFVAGDFSKSVTEQVKQKTTVRLNVNTDNIAGVQLPDFELKGEDQEDFS
jgi:vacuolar-type H+-ATPase subunit D/Vma8